MQRTLAVVAGVVMIVFVLVGARSPGATIILGTVALSPYQGSSASGSASLSADSSGAVYAWVQASGLNTLSQAGVAIMTADCGAVIAWLNPIATDGAGDGSVTVRLPGSAATGVVWIGVLWGPAISSSVAACGHTGGSPTPSPTATPASPMLVPVQYYLTLPTPTPPPPGSGGGPLVH